MGEDLQEESESITLLEFNLPSGLHALITHSVCPNKDKIEYLELLAEFDCQLLRYN